jgi:hypothetical protein
MLDETDHDGLPSAHRDELRCGGRGTTATLRQVSERFRNARETVSEVSVNRLINPVNPQPDRTLNSENPQQ